MITAERFIAEAANCGFDFYTGVPCSFLTPLINGVLAGGGVDYVGAASEGEAVAIAAGAWLAGRNTVVMCQNSGLGNAVNPLTSLNAPFAIPTLLITTWRGQPGIHDEPQHVLMGKITPQLLSVLELEHEIFPKGDDALASALRRAAGHIARTEASFAFIMEQDCLTGDAAPQTLAAKAAAGVREDMAGPGALPTRAAVLERFLARVDPAAAIIATTGKCGRELFTLADRPQHLYQVGSMGGATGMALGVALNTSLPVVVLDGDGAALMKLGSMATVGAYAPAGFIHLVLDNGVYDSTGGQPTVSASVDFAAVAIACGYRYAASCCTLQGFDAAFRRAATAAKPALIHVRIAPGSMSKLGRPTVAPREVARRFKDYLATAAAPVPKPATELA
ncbi:MAG TPA: phosphonopyruvate decarboxylase [Methylomirabilota bacterium]|nr:phosphonopyruvate decarboxylase [Methylomirabilota bacterium]